MLSFLRPSPSLLHEESDAAICTCSNENRLLLMGKHSEDALFHLGSSEGDVLHASEIGVKKAQGVGGNGGEGAGSGEESERGDGFLMRGD